MTFYDVNMIIIEGEREREREFFRFINYFKSVYKSSRVRLHPRIIF
jgi:hypothetical protein